MGAGSLGAYASAWCVRAPRIVESICEYNLSVFLGTIYVPSAPLQRGLSLTELVGTPTSLNFCNADSGF